MKRYSVYSYTTVVLLRIILGLWFFINGRDLTEVQGWHIQFSFLLLLSLLPVLLLSRASKTSFIFFLLSSDFFIILLASYPLQNIFILQLMMFTHFWIVVSVINEKSLLVYCCFVLGLSQYFNGASLIAGVALPGLSGTERIILLLGQLLMLGLIYQLNRIGVRSDESLAQRELYEQNLSNLLEINLDLQNYAIREKKRTREDERKRIARELHDILMHSLLNLRMTGEAMQDHIPESSQKLQELLNLSDSILKDVWENIENEIYDIRNRTDVEKEGLNRISDMINTFQDATQISVQIEYSNFPWSLGSKMDRIIYRVIQEGLTNAFRHGKADSILIILWQEPQSYRLVVRDNGSGSKKGSGKGSGMGLWGIQQRLSSVNGTVKFNSSSIGFEISATIPRIRSDDE